MLHIAECILLPPTKPAVTLKEVSMRERFGFSPWTAPLLFFIGIAVAAPASAADTYQLDPVHTSVTFKVKHLNVTFVYGRFNDVAGTLVFDEADPANSSIHVQVKTASIDTFNAKRDDHLRSPDFFDAAAFPVIEFRSTAVRKVDPETYNVQGDLTLHGVTRSVMVAAILTGAGKDPWGNDRIGFETVFLVKRTDFGMANNLQVAGDDVRLTVSVEGVRKQ
jgi:polyisoprenoid-binding protein YceI